VTRDRAPHLLVSVHDVSPLTLESCRGVVALLDAAGVPCSALTVLVIPFHDHAIAIDQHAPTLRFVHDLADRGASLVAHGYSHRMTRAPANPLRWLAARWFARSQGELAGADLDETHRCLDRADAIFERAGLTERLTGFVPPAWMLSRAATVALAARAYAFHETFRGIETAGQVTARRLIGWGSLTGLEALATSLWARVQLARTAVDTRLAVHPADVSRAVTRRSVTRTMKGLLASHQPVSYATHLRTVALGHRVLEQAAIA
jgi:predicted deacetylase